MRTRHVLMVLTALVVLAAVGVYVLVQRIGDHLPQLLPPGRACVVDAGNASVVPPRPPRARTARWSWSRSRWPTRPPSPPSASAATCPTGPGRRPGHRVAGVEAGEPRRRRPRLDRPVPAAAQPGLGHPGADRRPALLGATRFYTALLKVKGWEKMRVTDAAQGVQRSAYPEAYEKWADESAVLARALIGDATGAVACTVPGPPARRGEAAAARSPGAAAGLGRRGPVAGVTDLAALALPGHATRGPAGSTRTGWSRTPAGPGVKRVRYDGLEWTAKSGGWAQVTQRGGYRRSQVVAEVLLTRTWDVGESDQAGCSGRSGVFSALSGNRNSQVGPMCTPLRVTIGSFPGFRRK